MNKIYGLLDLIKINIKKNMIQNHNVINQDQKGMQDSFILHLKVNKNKINIHNKIKNKFTTIINI